MCGFSPCSSLKEKAHVRSLTRPGRGSIATSWPPVWSKVNICRESTVQAGTWGLCVLLNFAIPLPLRLPPFSPLQFSAFFMCAGGPRFPKGWTLSCSLKSANWSAGHTGSPAFCGLSADHIHDKTSQPGSVLSVHSWTKSNSSSLCKRSTKGFNCLKSPHKIQACTPFCFSTEGGGLLQICREMSAGLQFRALSVLSLMIGDCFNWGWGAVCTAQFCPH